MIKTYSHYLLFGFLILNFNASAFGQLTSVEQEIVQQIEANNVQALELLGKVVNINSGTLNFTGVKKVGDIFRKELDDLGFKTNWIDGQAFQRSGHLLANHPGKGKHLLLIGHLDTVFEPESPIQQYIMIDSNTMRGPGVCDMKGGDVIIIYALKALKKAGLLDAMNITVIMNGDEERSGKPLSLARKVLIEVAQSADVALGFENGDGNPKTAVIARRGSSSWKLTVSGNPAHSSQIFNESVGAGAIYEASRILNQFYQKLAAVEYLTFSPGLIVGGTSVNYDSTQSRGSAFGKNNVVAGTSLVTGDLRTISAQQLENTKSVMKNIVEKHLPGTSADMIFYDSYPPLAPTGGNKKLLGIYDNLSRELGFGPVSAVHPNKVGAADVSFTAPYVDMVIDGLGLCGADDHTENETADLTTLPMQTKRAAILLYRLFRQ